jgi:hypothetical protein
MFWGLSTFRRIDQAIFIVSNKRDSVCAYEGLTRQVFFVCCTVSALHAAAKQLDYDSTAVF